MIERVAILMLIAAGVLALGFVGRGYARLRRARAIASLQPVVGGTATPRIVSFYGPSCDACDRQKAVLSELESERLGRLAVELHDATLEYDYARTFGLVIVPTTVVFGANGSIAGINSGLTRRPVLEAQLDAA